MSRVVIANLTSSFMSSRSRYQNIAQIIKAMLVRGITNYDASILKVNEHTLQSLEQCTFYTNSMLFSLDRDYECRDIFEEWFGNLENGIYLERYESIRKFCKAVYGNRD